MFYHFTDTALYTYLVNLCARYGTTVCELEVSDTSSDILFGIYTAFNPCCEMLIKYCQAIAEIMQLADA